MPLKSADLNLMRQRGILFIGPGLARFTRTTVRENIISGDTQYKSIMAAEVHLRAAVGYGLALATPMMNLTEARFFGAKVDYPEDLPPTVTEPVMTSADDADRLPRPRMDDVHHEMLKLLRMLVTIDVIPNVAGSILGPYSLAASLRGQEVILTDLYDSPADTHRLLRRTTDFLKDLTRQVLDTGVNVLKICEPKAGMVGPEQCEEFSSQYVKELFGIANEYRVKILLHNCGDSVINTAPGLAATGAHILSIGDRVLLPEVMAKVKSSLMVAGNLAAAYFSERTDPSAVYQAAGRLLVSAADFKNHAACGGCDLPSDATIDNITAFFRAVRDFRRQTG